MRVQHNIAAMNSYRNYGNNTKTINKNLEKLSSGYKINRAGDDAAGLAISEKMRAQITGLEGAQKNAKDGISLVQTAEGALTEVHSMLNRMVSLAEQSANGTYDNATDRDQLQKEVNQLRTEIDRIANSSNFNGIKLLDGSLSSSGSSAATGVPSVSGLLLTNNAGTNYELKKDFITNNSGGVIDVVGKANNQGVVAGDVLKVRFEYTDVDGNLQNATINLTVNESGNLVMDNGELAGYQGDAADVTGNGANTALGYTFTDTDKLIKAFSKAANADSKFSQTFQMTTDGTIKAKVADSDVQIIDASANWDPDKAIVKTPGSTQTLGNDIMSANSTAPTTAQLQAAGVSPYQSSNMADLAMGDVFSINGTKFAFVGSDAEGAALQGVRTVTVANSGSIVAADVTKMQSLIHSETGYKPEINATTATQFDFKAPVGGAYKASGGLRLQIGDTAESFNQLDVSISDMHASSLEIAGVDISTQSGAADAMNTLKAAINKVSDVRGTLGATQNRLEHTINNLSVMQENIQDAESTIRDTDVADEMMKYTKNSILVQSAQAMLAQANQQPQGVLQLLQ